MMPSVIFCAASCTRLRAPSCLPAIPASRVTQELVRSVRGATLALVVVYFI